MTAQILGISNDITTCECCGKSNLKKTVVLEIGEAVVHYGSDCAGKALYGKKSAGNTKDVTFRATAIAMAKDALAKGMAPVKVKAALFNRFGLQVSISQNVMLLGSFGRIAL
jgi:hypothetical protein